MTSADRFIAYPARWGDEVELKPGAPESPFRGLVVDLSPASGFLICEDSRGRIVTAHKTSFLTLRRARP